jgi:Uncharacterized archaeal kinase related to aspartokinases, uridylate kinases
VDNLFVLKLSGHMINHSEILAKTIHVLRSLAQLAKFMLVPGGSIFADYVRDLQVKMGFSDDVAHWLAIKAMEMYGAYIARIDESGIIIEAHDLVEAYEVLKQGKIPIVMPYRILRRFNELPHDWSVTSDSISVYIANLVKADMIVLAKPVDGVLDKGGNLIRKMTIEELEQLNNNIVDQYVVKLLHCTKLPLVIYNMFKPFILRKIVNREAGDYTLITP